MTDKLTTLTTNVARLLDGALALPADADRQQATLTLADALITEAVASQAGADNWRPEPAQTADLHIAGFTIGYCDDGSAFLQADNRPGEDGVSVRIDYLSSVLSTVYEVAKSNLPMQATASGDNPHYEPEIGSLDAALSALDLPEGDLAAKVIAREQNLEADNDCGDACKI
jgi:hypothetical protein